MSDDTPNPDETAKLQTMIEELKLNNLHSEIEFIQHLCSALSCLKIDAYGATMPNPVAKDSPQILCIFIPVSTNLDDLEDILVKAGVSFPAPKKSSEEKDKIERFVSALNSIDIEAVPSLYWKKKDENTSANKLEPCLMIPINSLAKFQTLFAAGMLS